MNTHFLIETEYSKQTEDFASCVYFQNLEKGAATAKNYDDFIANVCRTHLKSPQIVAFLYSVAPPAAAENLKHNMLEELGLDETGVSHPELLLKLAKAAGFDEIARKSFEISAQEEFRRVISDPILFGTLKEVGLSALLETTAFEWMLSRLASRMAKFLEENKKLSRENLEWFLHHSEVDIRHAEEGLQAVADYIEFYEFDTSDVEMIIDVTFRENVFIKRYFGEIALAKQIGALS